MVFETSAQTVAGEQSGVIERLEALNGQLCVLILIQVEGTESADDLLGDHMHQRLAPASVGVDRRTPQHDSVLGAQYLHRPIVARQPKSATLATTRPPPISAFVCVCR